MRCLKCGMPFDDGMSGCPHCGAVPKAREKSDEVQLLSQRPQLEDDTITPASPGKPAPPAKPCAPIQAPGGVDLDHDIPDELLNPEEPSALREAAGKTKGNLMLIAWLGLALVFINRHTHVFDDILGRSKKPAKAEPETPPPAMPAPTRPVADEAQPQDTPAPGPETQPQAPPAEPKTPAQAPDAVAAWRFEGRIYDMVTLRPIRGAQLVFMGGDQDYTFTTDKQGVYKAKVPPLDGASYQVLVDHADYLEGYFDETAPMYRERPRAARIGMRNAKPRNKPWEGGAAVVQRDLVLFPEVSY